MTRLKGTYSEYGLALDDVALFESLQRYQSAINRLGNGLSRLVISGVDATAEILGIYGSVVSKSARLGVYQDLPFNVVNEMQTHAKCEIRFLCPKYVGEYWSGNMHEILKYPSDVDVLVKHQSTKPLSLTESCKISDEVTQITKGIFNETGVFIHFFNWDSEKNLIAPELVVGNGLLAWYTAEQISKQVA